MDKKLKEGVKETARDLIALGSVPFFILVLVRVYLLNNQVYFSQFIIAGILFILISLLTGVNLYSGLGLIILAFTNLYYQDIRFGIFSILAYILLITSLIYLRKTSKDIIKGVVFGVLSSGIAYYAVKFIVG